MKYTRICCGNGDSTCNIVSLFERLQGERYCTTNSDTKSDKDGTDPGTDNVQEDSQKVLENLKAEGEKLKTEAQDFKVHKKKK